MHGQMEMVVKTGGLQPKTNTNEGQEKHPYETGELTEESLMVVNINLAREIEEEQRTLQIQEFRKIPRGVREENRRKAMEKVQQDTRSWNENVQTNRPQLIRTLQEYRDETQKELEEEERKGGFQNRQVNVNRRMVPVPLYINLPRKPYRRVKDLLFGKLRIPLRHIIGMSWINGFRLEILMEETTRKQVQELMKEVGIKAKRSQNPEDETMIKRTERLRDLVRDTRNISANNWYLEELERMMPETSQPTTRTEMMITIDDEGVRSERME